MCTTLCRHPRAHTHRTRYARSSCYRPASCSFARLPAVSRTNHARRPRSGCACGSYTTRTPNSSSHPSLPDPGPAEFKWVKVEISLSPLHAYPLSRPLFPTSDPRQASHWPFGRSCLPLSASGPSALSCSLDVRRVGGRVGALRDDLRGALVGVLVEVGTEERRELRLRRCEIGLVRP